MEDKYLYGYSEAGDAYFFEYGEQSKGVIDPKHDAILHPVNNATGFPDGDLGRLADPQLTQYEREQIMSRLSKISGEFAPSQLSDSELFSLIPPRYFHDAVDVQRWRDYIAKDILPHLEDSKVAEKIAEENNNNENKNDNENKKDNTL